MQVQQDEMKPRQIESFRGRILAIPDGVVSKGGREEAHTRDGAPLFSCLQVAVFAPLS